MNQLSAEKLMADSKELLEQTYCVDKEILHRAPTDMEVNLINQIVISMIKLGRKKKE